MNLKHSARVTQEIHVSVREHGSKTYEIISTSVHDWHFLTQFVSFLEDLEHSPARLTFVSLYLVSELCRYTFTSITLLVCEIWCWHQVQPKGTTVTCVLPLEEDDLVGKGPLLPCLPTGIEAKSKNHHL